jgi:hypothetical protein
MAAPGATPKSDSGVAELQRVLKAYVQLTGYAPADPGTVDGIVGARTAMAVIAMLPRVPGMPEEIRALAPVMALLLATADGQKQAYGIITRNAGTISKGIIALEAYRIGSGATTPPTPTAASIKAGTLWQPGGNPYAVTSNTVTAPIVYTAGGAIPGNPAQAIWFYDLFSRNYRLAVPKQGLSGFSDYVEVAPSMSEPNAGVRVSRSAFMSATGRWWGTYLGMAAIGFGAIGASVVAYRGARAVL